MIFSRCSGCHLSLLHRLYRTNLFLGFWRMDEFRLNRFNRIALCIEPDRVPVLVMEVVLTEGQFPPVAVFPAFVASPAVSFSGVGKG